MARPKPFRSQKLKNSQKDAVATKMSIKWALEQKIPAKSQLLEKMGEMYRKVNDRNAPLAVIDLQGVLFRITKLDCEKQKIVARKHLHAFMRTVVPLYDIIIYSNLPSKTVAFCYYRYLCDYALLFFDENFFINDKICLEPFVKQNKKVIFIASDLQVLDNYSKAFLIKAEGFYEGEGGSYLKEFANALVNSLKEVNVDSASALHGP